MYSLQFFWLQPINYCLHQLNKFQKIGLIYLSKSDNIKKVNTSFNCEMNKVG